MADNKLIKILLVDDDPDIQEFMTYNLRKEDYDVYSALNGVEAIEIANKIIPDLIILDVMMPGIDGMEVCKRIRNTKSLSNVLICFLTARGEDYSQLAGFDAGADDYITKPVKPAIFIKKIDALLRISKKYQQAVNTNSYESANLSINFDTRIVKVNSEEIIFAKKEFALIKLLVSVPGKVFTRDEIYSSIWGDDIIVGDRTIDVHIRKLREKIGNERISTLKGIGYKFNE